MPARVALGVGTALVRSQFPVSYSDDRGDYPLILQLPCKLAGTRRGVAVCAVEGGAVCVVLCHSVCKGRQSVASVQAELTRRVRGRSGTA